MRRISYIGIVMVLTFALVGCNAQEQAKKETKTTSKPKVAAKVAKEQPIAEENKDTKPPESQQAAQAPAPAPAPAPASAPKPAPQPAPKSVPAPAPAGGQQQNDIGVVNSYSALLYNVSKGLPVSSSSNPKIMETYKRAQQIVSSVVNSGMTQSQKEKALHDYLLSNTVYNANSADSYNPYGALINGSATCGGYAEAMKLLLNLSGIEAYEVWGTANGERHAWNIVKVDGKYYHVDSTWDDGATISYAFYNRTDNQMKNDRFVWNYQQYPSAN